jgi:hypothetical protein
MAGNLLAFPNRKTVALLTCLALGKDPSRASRRFQSTFLAIMYMTLGLSLEPSIEFDFQTVERAYAWRADHSSRARRPLRPAFAVGGRR